MGTRSVLGLAAAVGLALGFVLSYAPAADAGRNSSGSYSLPSGPAIPGTVISSSWMNTTLTDLGTEVTNSLDRQGRGAMLAPLQLPNGTSSAPALTFSSEPASGLYRAGAGDVRMQMQTVQTQRWTASGVVFPVAVTTNSTVTALGAVSAQAGLTATDSIGTAITATGGAPNGSGIIATGQGNGLGLKAVGGATAAHALEAQTGTAATGGARRVAVALYGGDLSLVNVVHPDSTTAVSKTLTPKSIVGAWVTAVTNGAGAVTAADGLNVTSVGLSAGQLVVTFAAGFANANHACVVSGSASDETAFVVSATTTTATFGVTTAATGVPVSLATNGRTLRVICMGAQ